MFSFIKINNYFKLIIPGYEFFLVKNKGNIANNIIFDKTISLSFGRPECEDLTLYQKSLSNSDMEWTDNIYKQLRVLNFLQNLDFAIQHNPSGDFVELGVWKGLSADMIIKKLINSNINPRVVLADSFEGGLSEKNQQDTNVRSHQTTTEIINEKNQFYSTQSHLEKVTEDYSNKLIIPGWLPMSLNDVAFSRGISFIHFDLDLYQPTIESLKSLWIHVLHNGVITFDDYNSAQFPGVTKAVDEFYEQHKHEVLFFYKVPFGSAFIVKK